MALLKFNCFVADRGNKVHNLSADTLMVLLTDTAPNAADTVVDTTQTPCKVISTSNAVEIAAAAGGYTKTGVQLGSNVYSQTGGTAKLVGAAVTFTATSAPFAQFRYAVLYNLSAGTSAARPVIGYWDLGSEINLAVGQSIALGKDATGAAWDASTPVLSDA